MRSRYLSQSDILRLRSAMSAEEWLPLRVSLDTGLRLGDVLKIRPSDIKNGVLSYVAEKTQKSGQIKLKNSLISTLMHNSNELWCFPSPKDGTRHLTRQAVWYRVKKAAARSCIDLPGVSPHSMRKVFAVSLYEEKGMRAVQLALQHNNLSTTEIYTLSDWTSGENADLPLLRSDIPLIIQKIVDVVILRLDKIKNL